MKCISAETVETTWQTIADMDPADAGQAMFDFSQVQPNLLGFVMALSEDLENDASELCTYMLYVVYQMFVNATSERIPTVTEQQIEAQYEATCKMLDAVHDAGDGAEVAEVTSQIENQPYVYQYVSEALLEEDPDNELNISDEEVGEIFMMMKCVIDVVDSVTN